MRIQKIPQLEQGGYLYERPPHAQGVAPCRIGHPFGNGDNEIVFKLAIEQLIVPTLRGSPDTKRLPG
jgi:hypothetical protein